MGKYSKQEWVYESPDGGSTIYRRKAGNLKREQILGPDVATLADDDEFHEQMEIDFGEHYQNAPYKEWTWWDDQHEWEDMKKVAKEHPALQAAIDHAIMIYKLSKEEDDNDEDLPF